MHGKEIFYLVAYEIINSLKVVYVNVVQCAHVYSVHYQYLLLPHTHIAHI